jgi:hypothetical protein
VSDFRDSLGGLVRENRVAVIGHVWTRSWRHSMDSMACADTVLMSQINRNLVNVTT